MVNMARTNLSRLSSLLCLLFLVCIFAACTPSSKQSLNQENMGEVDSGGTIMYAKEWMSIRDSASNNGNVIAKTAPGDAVVDLGKQQGGWTYVRQQSSSIRGWIPSKSLSASKNITKSSSKTTKQSAKPMPAPQKSTSSDTTADSASTQQQSQSAPEQDTASTPSITEDTNSTAQTTPPETSETTSPATSSSSSNKSVLSPNEAQAATSAPQKETPAAARPAVKPDAFDPF